MYIVYKTTNLVTNQIYIGVHRQSTESPYEFDGYLGSGNWKSFWTEEKRKFLHSRKESLAEAIKIYGIDNFKRETLYYSNDITEAYLQESILVTDEFIKSPDNYNLVPGGRMPPNHKNFMWITNDITEARIFKDTDIPDGYKRGRLPVKDSTKEKQRINCLKNGNKPPLHTKENGLWTPERLERNKELLNARRHKIKIVHSPENRLKASERVSGVNNPMYNTKFCWITNGEEQIRWTDTMENIPDGFRLGTTNKGKKFKRQEISMCPYCSKEGGRGNMKRWHFENCKLKPN